MVTFSFAELCILAGLSFGFGIGVTVVVTWPSVGRAVREPIRYRRSRDLELRHRASDPDEDAPDTLTPTTGDGDQADEVVNRSRFADWSGSGWRPAVMVPPPPRVVMAPSWIAALTGQQVDAEFASMTAGLREDPDLPIFAEVSGALVMQTAAWEALGRPGAVYVPPPAVNHDSVRAGMALVHSAARVTPQDKPRPRPTTPPSGPAPRGGAR